MKKNKNLKGFICMALALVMVLGSSFAYFTDRADTSASGTAGTVGVDLTSDINLLDEDGKDILNPGDLRDGSFGVENTGNKSIDVRTTIVLTSSVAMDKTAAQAEYELYLKDDVEFVEGKGWMPKDGAQPLEVRSISEDGKTITYNLPDYILNGNEDFGDDKREIEEGITTDSHDNDFVLIFKAGSSNDFQDSVVTIDVLVEAKQHRNTGAGWDIVAQESYVSGAINQNAVLKAEDEDDGNIEVTPDPVVYTVSFRYLGRSYEVECPSGTYAEVFAKAEELNIEVDYITPNGKYSGRVEESDPVTSDHSVEIVELGGAISIGIKYINVYIDSETLDTTDKTPTVTLTNHLGESKILAPDSADGDGSYVDSVNITDSGLACRAEIDTMGTFTITFTLEDGETQTQTFKYSGDDEYFTFN